MNMPQLQGVRGGEVRAHEVPITPRDNRARGIVGPDGGLRFYALQVFLRFLACTYAAPLQWTLMHRTIIVAAIALIAGVLVGTPNAHAFLAPLHSVDTTHFIAPNEAAQIVRANIRAERQPNVDAEGPDDGWLVTAEIAIRNHSHEDITVPVAVTDSAEFEERTVVYVNGVSVELEVIDPGFDPAHPEVVVDHAQRFELSLPSQALVFVRTEFVVQAVTDDAGQVFLSLPTNYLGMWEAPIEAAFIEVALNDRGVGIQTTLSGYTLYDEPLNRLSWYSMDWVPTRPREVAFMPAWSALLRVAQVESCPEPWVVVEHISAGNMDDLNQYLAGYDPDSLQFCAALPLMVHGYVFESDNVRRQFGEIPLSRYLGSDVDRGSIYRENPAFDSDMLTAVEAIYRRTLRSAAP